MHYDTTQSVWKCVCKNGFTLAGDTCIETAAAQKITNTYSMNMIVNLKYEKELEVC